MTDSLPEPQEPDPEHPDREYIVEYIDGPLAGDYESRLMVDGLYDDRIGVMAAVEGMESVFWYSRVDEREVHGKVHVRYRFDPQESDPYVSVPDDE